MAKKKNPNKIFKTKVENIKLDIVKPKRAGIILYTVDNGILYFGLGLDAATHDVTDFGGSILYNVDKNVVNGALREFNEETLNIFNTLTIEEIKSCPVIYDKDNLIIFVHLNVDRILASNIFLKQYQSLTQEHENCSIVWLTFDELLYSINNSSGILFDRVQNFLSRAGDISLLI